MNAFSGLLATIPPDPRFVDAGVPPAALNQATPTPSGPAGATAQTGGFVQPGEAANASAVSNGTSPAAASGTGAGSDTKTSWTSGISSFLAGPAVPESNATTGAIGGVYSAPLGIGTLGGMNPALLGGLASSPLVPRPGTSIDPSTGKPHVAGMTRAELEAKRAAEASTTKEATGVAGVTGTSGPTGEALEDLGGKEQAARQLTGTVPVPAGAGTGASDPAASTATQHTVMGDVNYGLEKVVGMLPQGVKERIAGVNDPKGKMTQQEADYRLSPQSLLETAKNSSGKLFQDVKDAIHDIQGDLHDRSAAHAKADEQAGRSPGMIAGVKEFWADIAGSVGGPDAMSVAEGKSLPSKEVDGAKPGDFSTGVGALPGKSTEAGVAVLPDEKKLLAENQGPLPGEVPLTKSALSPESDASKTSESAVLATASAGGAAIGAGAYALAPALPATNLGQGAAQGATDLDPIKGISTSTFPTVSTASSAPAPASAARLAPPGTFAGGERTTSMASITAINRGHEGNRQSRASPLVDSTLARQANEQSEQPSSGVGLGAGAAGAAGGALASSRTHPSHSGKSSTDLKDTAPGRNEDGVGHPSTRCAETTREPGTYPKADLNAPAEGDRHTDAAERNTKATPVGASPSAGQSKTETPVSQASGLGTAGTVPATSPRASTTASTESPQTPKSPLNGGTGVAVGDDSHTPKTPQTAGAESDAKRRTSSGGSGKKKVGFMSKLKGEMKVLSGKLDNDKEKVEAGKRMMHGK